MRFAGPYLSPLTKQIVVLRELQHIFPRAVVHGVSQPTHRCCLLLKVFGIVDVRRPHQDQPCKLNATAVNAKNVANAVIAIRNRTGMVSMAVTAARPLQNTHEKCIGSTSG